MKPGWEWVLVLLIVLLLFGAKRLPDTARSLGRSMRILKAETKGLRDDDAPSGADTNTSDAGAGPVRAEAQALPPAGTPVVQPGGGPGASPSSAAPSAPGGHRADDR